VGVLVVLRHVAETTDVRSVALDIEEGNAASMRVGGRLGAERREPWRVELDRGGVPRTLVVFVLAIAR
jgi:RimJ/RimL family protein N-acetyltransferase